ncbi:reticuline oxidase-like [Olea europaea subsp. europaea]|uniref:Reticuline oxidase-like n=1 Tax=Olea europaea subsp. europaea TaxID=158383 RepID=A0A8S0UVS8_OLEEU|nr:reticuline oxidase-like [Olea europaea subsp. europaea]
MKFLITFPSLIIFIYLVPSVCDSHAEAQTLASCLMDQGVYNFSLYPSTYDNDPTVYFKFLGFSIQNLRFSDSSVPKPMAIIMPESKEQLMNSVLCCGKGLWEIRVRCGGHSYEGTSYVVSDGNSFVLIDMMNLDRVSVDLDAEMAWVEGGATLGQTYYSIAESSRFHGFSAGSCPTVGIGGHIAGGGFGLLSRKYGVAADNVVDALLVDAHGRLLNREAMGEEVFWAIRGGGGGIWGIVYAWKIQLLKVPEIVTGLIVSRPGSKRYVANIVQKWQHVAPRLEDEFYLSAFVGAGLPQMKKSIGISATFKGFYLGPKAEALKIIRSSFPELGVLEEDCNEMSWIESILYFSGLDDGSSMSDLKNRYLQDKHYFKAKSDYVKTPISRIGITSAINILDKEPKGYVILDPYGGIMEKISSDSIAFPHRKGNLYTIQYVVEWKEEDNAKNGKNYIDWIRGFYNSMAPYVSSGPRAAYINYIDFDLGVMYLLNSSAPSDDAVEEAKVWGEKYFLKNYDRLVRAKTLIDPFNVFRHQQGIPPMSATKGKAEV